MKNNPIPRKHKRGFTLIELLVVIAILALLMSIIIITLNPAEMLRKARDTKRITDLSSIRTALNLYMTDVVDPQLGTTTTCFVSLPSEAVGCTVTCGSAAICRTGANLRLVTGAGWVPVNFNQISSGSPLSALPVDPTNATSSTYWLYYSYVADNTLKTFELNANMESSYFRSTSTGVLATDGGNTEKIYEVGSDPGLDLATSATMFGATTSGTWYAAP